MLKNLFMKTGKVLTAAVGLGILAGCAPDPDRKTADLAYVNWAEGIAYTNLAKVILEDKMGYDVNITATEVGMGYTAVADGGQDAFMETWLPVLHASYYEEYGDRLVDLGHVYEGTQSGLVVPAYVDIDTISELGEHADRFGGRIVGIDAGAGVMSTTEEVIEKYDLDIELMASSGPAMTAELEAAIQDEEWIVVTGWRPHWKFGRWDLKFLEQDQEQVWDTENIHILGREDIWDDKPELAEFLSNMYFTDEQLSDLMVQVEESDLDVEEVARQWMQDNEELIESWIPEIEPDIEPEPEM